MSIDRDILEKELEEYISLFAKDRKITMSVTKELNNKNVLDGDVLSIFKMTTPIATVSLSFLYVFTQALYGAIKFHKVDKKFDIEKINPEKYFTPLEINEGKQWKQDVSTENDKYPVVFKDIIKLKDGVWLTSLTIQELSEMFNTRTLVYNPETQRPLRRTEKNDTIIERIDINPKSVQNIERLVSADLFIPNCITINALIDEELDLIENLKDKTVTITSGKLNLTDGWHRNRGYIRALQKNPNLDYRTGVLLTRLDVDRAKDYIYQESRHNPINEEYTKTLNPDRMANQIVENINTDKKSFLKGKITKDNIMIKTGKALIMFNTLADVIDFTFNPKEQKEVYNISKFLIKGLNHITNIYEHLLKDHVDSKIWSVYLCMLYFTYKKENWEAILDDMLVNFDMDSVNMKAINKVNVKNIINSLRALFPETSEVNDIESEVK